ncbi:MAG TPA: hypothetical protein VE968_08695 [Sphingomicrobium sp.]|nr:hypothetical protein [Sphingomicrobium sp.]
MTQANAASDYALCGWRFRSEIPVEALPAWDGDPARPPDIELVRGSVPEVACQDPVSVVANGRNVATVVSVEAGRFAVTDGKRVVADVRPDALPGFVEVTIAGPVLGTICYQRDIVSLHSNTILIDGKAIAISGRSGAGKSTMAAMLMKRGHRLISDDVLPIFDRGGCTYAQPGSQNLRLWGEALELIGVSKDGLRRADGVRDKYFLPTADKTTQPWPLAALIWLERGVTERHFLRPCKSMFRSRAIFKAIYRQHLWRDFAAMGSPGITNLALPGVAVFDLLRPRSLDLLEEQAKAIENLASMDDLPKIDQPVPVRAAHR